MNSSKRLNSCKKRALKKGKKVFKHEKRDCGGEGVKIKKLYERGLSKYCFSEVRLSNKERREFLNKDF